MGKLLWILWSGITIIIMKRCKSCGGLYPEHEMSIGSSDGDECKDCYLSAIDASYMTE
jgi:hypothetical protein